MHNVWKLPQREKRARDLGNRVLVTKSLRSLESYIFFASLKAFSLLYFVTSTPVRFWSRLKRFGRYPKKKRTSRNTKKTARTIDCKSESSNAGALPSN